MLYNSNARRKHFVFGGVLFVLCSDFLLSVCSGNALKLAPFWYGFGHTILWPFWEYFVRLCGGFSAPFHLPHISRLPHGFSCVPLGLNTPYPLCSSFVRFNHYPTASPSSKPHQNIIKIACILLAFWLLSKKHARKYCCCGWTGKWGMQIAIFKKAAPSGGI